MKLEVNEEKTPVWHAVLCAFIYPVMASLMTLLNKYANLTLRLNPTDWVCAHSFLFSIVATVIGVIYWSINQEEFIWQLFVVGFFAGISTLFGALLIVRAFNIPRAPLGPTVALLASQVLYLVIVDALVKHSIPVPLQFIGLFLGIIGTLTLSIPDHMLNLLYCITCCGRRRREEATGSTSDAGMDSAKKSDRLSFYSQN